MTAIINQSESFTRAADVQPIDALPPGHFVLDFKTRLAHAKDGKSLRSEYKVITDREGLGSLRDEINKAIGH